MKRQGDILFVPVNFSQEALKGDVKKVENMVVAEGEATGHAHRVRAAAGVAVLAVLGELYIRSQQGEPIHIDHEEHDTITLPPGDYQVIRQREYNPDAIRQVAD